MLCFLAPARVRLWRGCFLLAVASLVVHAQPLTFSTFAGPPGGPGSTDGTGSAAHFFGPSAVAADKAGNVYVADAINRTIRKITPGGAVSTLAGLAGTFDGSRDGTGSVARFGSGLTITGLSGPFGVMVDSAGNVYVADTFNHTIRKITATGMVTTLAGSARVAGSEDGTGDGAHFQYPLHLHPQSRLHSRHRRHLHLPARRFGWGEHEHHHRAVDGNPSQTPHDGPLAMAAGACH